MNKQIIVALALSFSLYTFAQKKEVKSFEKAVKSENYTEAKSMISQLEPMVSSMDDKLKAKYYLNKAKALYSNGNIQPQDIDTALESLTNAEGEYKPEVSQIRSMAEQALLQKANTAYTAQNYSVAAKGFATLYKVVPSDQSYMYYAAQSALQAKDYNAALGYFITLKEIGYTGVGTQYLAINKETGEEEILSQATRDSYVKIGTHIKPTERKTESKEAEVVKMIALLYIQKGENEKALEAINDARAKNPDDANLIVSEANIYIKLKQEDKASELFKQALTKDPNNADLTYNVGVLAMSSNKLDDAKTYFEKALSIDSSYENAALNLSSLFLKKGEVIVKEMNGLGNSNADFKKYDALKIERKLIYEKGAMVLENFLEKNPNSKNVDTLNQLKNIYSALGETAKVKAIKAKLSELGVD
ncbi:tetratricopeptide repeat protein [Aurantibacter sp.]|uniref:tetratricopeptide repeat protein n=1 Tax=Aurantibacter sp. TaxID=2807103 RepID=UPI0035C84FB9